MTKDIMYEIKVSICVVCHQNIISRLVFQGNYEQLLKKKWKMSLKASYD